MILVTAALITLAIANGALMLALFHRILAAQRKQTEQVRFVLSYMVDAIGSLNDTVENSMDCLVTLDAELDAVQNPSTELHVEC